MHGAAWPSTCPARRGGARRVDGRRRARRRAAIADGTRAAIGPRLAARALRRRDARRGSRGRPGQRDALRLARAGPMRRRPRAGPRRPRWCSGARAPAPRAGSCPAWRCSRSPASTSRGSSRARCARGMGEYMFFLDLEGSMADPAVAGAVEGLRGHAEVVRVLGSFPTAESTFAAVAPLHSATVATAVPPGPLGSVPLGDHPRHGPDP